MTEASTPTLTLEIRQPGREPVVRTVTAARTIIGRESGDLALEDPEASAIHAELDCSSGHAIVRDLGSSNGTWRSGKRLPQFALFEGQSFVCGTTEIFLVKIEGTDAHPHPGQTASGARADILDGPSKKTLMGMPGTPSSKTAPADAPGWDPPSAPSITETLPASNKAGAQTEGTDTTLVPQLGQPAPSFATPTSEFESSRTIPRGSRQQVTQTEEPQPGNTAPSGDRASVLNATIDVPGGPGSVIPSEPPAPSGSTQPGTTGTSEVSEEAPTSKTDPFAATHASQDEVFRAPVANAVIQDPAAARDDKKKKAGSNKTVPRRRRPWGKWLATGGIAAVVAAAVFGIVYLVVSLLGSRGIDFAKVAARELPEETVAFVAVASPADVIELFGDSVDGPVREQAKERLKFDPWAEDDWGELGIDPAAPVSLGLVDVESQVFALTVGVADRSTLQESLANTLPFAPSGEPLNWTDRSFGDYEGRYLDKPIAAAVIYRDDRATLVFSAKPPSFESDGTASADALEDAVDLFVEKRDKATLADRDGFAGVIAPSGDVLAALYVDGASTRAAIKGSGVAEMALRMSLADIDGFAGFLSHEDDQVHATYEVIVREGGRPDEFIRGVSRKTVALDRLPGPVLASLDGVLDPEALDRNLGGVASLGAGSLAFIEDGFREQFGVDLREDVVGNLGGSYGVALTKLPSERGGEDVGVVAWLELADEAKAKEVTERIYAKVSESAGATASKVDETTVYRVESPPAALYIAHDHLWVTFGDVDEDALLAADAKGFLAGASPEVARALNKGGIAAGFADVQGLLEGFTVQLSESEKEELARFEAVTSKLQSVTLRAELDKQTVVLQQTLHTTGGLPALVQEVTKAMGSEYADALAAAARQEKCQRLAEHIRQLTEAELEKKGKHGNAAWEIEKTALEQCESPAMSADQLDCYLAASELSKFAECDALGSDSSASGETPTEEADPKPVAYVEDIWPDTQDDADSEKPQSSVNYAVDLGKAPQIRGSTRAPVTIVEFGDFECEYCRRSTAVLDVVLAKHGEDVRLVFRHNPLPIHPNARMAARAAIAAGRQGKFWAMHDKLYDNQGTLSEDNFRKWAEDLGLDLVAFDRDYYDAAVDRQVQRDLEAAKKFGATGTPVFFVNGRYLPGAQSAGAFDALIEEELARAKTFIERRGNTRKGLYEDMISHFAPEVIKPKSAPDLPDPDEKRFIVSTSGLPRKGASTFARVQMIECGDFDCPFCARAKKTLEELLDAYPTQIAFYWAHNPLSFHANAEPAARAAVAAENQDKFWEMHDLLFEEPDAREESDFIAMARRLSLDIPQFKKDFAAEETAEKVSNQQKLCRDNEAQGTPTFFVNGRRLAGAKPLESFKAIVDAELAAGI